jgi:small neutral amino acid transporter SnatA (MarC family)
MDNTILFVIIAVVIVAGIIWIVIYSGKRTRKHLAQTSIRAQESRSKTGETDQ